MISDATAKLILAGKLTLAARLHQRETHCSIGEAILVVRNWRKDRAEKIGKVK